MSIIYSFIFAIYIALGASCTGDLARFQKVLELNLIPKELEPGSTIFVLIANILNNDISASLIHFFAILTLLLSFRYFFLKTNLISSIDFYLISFISLLNPISFEIVSNNTRQLLFISIFSIPVYGLILFKFREFFEDKEHHYLKKTNINKFFIYSCLLISLITHSSSPIVFIFVLFYLIIYLFYKILFDNFFLGTSLKIKTSLNIKYFLGSFLLIIFVALIRNRAEYVINLYTPKGSELLNLIQDNSFAFDYNSPGLLISLLLTAFLIIYTFIRLPKKFIFFKILNLTLLAYTSFIIYFGLTIPFLSTFLRRAYQPILLILFPITLVILFTILQTKYKKIFIMLFLLLCLGWQSLKLRSANYSVDTFYSLNNNHISSCAPLRLQEK